MHQENAPVYIYIYIVQTYIYNYFTDVIEFEDCIYIGYLKGMQMYFYV